LNNTNEKKDKKETLVEELDLGGEYEVGEETKAADSPA
jgi:hypothetical protein